MPNSCSMAATSCMWPKESHAGGFPMLVSGVTSLGGRLKAWATTASTRADTCETSIVELCLALSVGPVCKDKENLAGGS